jgi:hypothetical protein
VILIVNEALSTLSLTNRVEGASCPNNCAGVRPAAKNWSSTTDVKQSLYDNGFDLAGVVQDPDQVSKAPQVLNSGRLAMQCLESLARPSNCFAAPLVKLRCRNGFNENVYRLYRMCFFLFPIIAVAYIAASERNIKFL